MSYNIFKKYGLDRIKDSFNENYDYIDETRKSDWQFVSCKTVLDFDGFITEYCWYTDGNKHIFMFGDSDVVTPDELYADHEEDSESAAQSWFDHYEGFSEEEEPEDELDNTPVGNSNFMNDGFNNVYGVDVELED